LNQSLVDILDNAVRAIDDALRSGTVDAGEIIVGTRKESIRGAHVVIAISDNGVGIPMDIQDKIFDPFFTTRVVGSGKGLGLSEAYGVIKNHGGTIDVDSAPGKGSCFTIRLPVNS
jgi:signal transduction histidine kinase